MAAGAIAGAVIVIGEQVITTAASVAVALLWLRDHSRVLESVALGALTAAAVFLLRKSANSRSSTTTG